jgi:hypothetical protein
MSYVSPNPRLKERKMTNRGENPEFAATAHFQDVAEKAIRQMYPRIKASDLRTAENVQAYLTREATHARFTMPTTLGTGIIREVVIEAIKHAMDEADPAYSAHGAEHKVFPEAGQRLVNHLTESPTKVGVQTVDDIFYDKRGVELRVEKYVLSTPWEQRVIYRPLYVEVGEQLKLLLDDMKAKNKEITAANIEKRRKRIIIEITKKVGVDFAILVCLCSGMNAHQVLEFFTEARDLENRPTKSRTTDIKDIQRVERLLRPDQSGALTFDRENQLTAASLVRGNRAWAHAPAAAWMEYASKPSVSSLAILGGATFAMAQIVDNKTPDFRDPARAKFVDRQAGEATTEVITMYNVYDHDATSLAASVDELVALLNT